MRDSSKSLALAETTNLTQKTKQKIVLFLWPNLLLFFFSSLSSAQLCVLLKRKEEKRYTLIFLNLLLRENNFVRIAK